MTDTKSTEFGLFDTHIHGFGGFDVMDNNFEALNGISKGLQAIGVEHWLATTVAASAEQLEAICKTVAESADRLEGAKLEGINFEGPFFTEPHKGAQNPKYLIDPDVKLFERWQKAAGGRIKQISMAPERQGTVEFIREVTQQGVVVAIGHTNCTYEEAVAAIDAGATVINHTFNGMPEFLHREPSLAGAALASDDRVFCEIICDGIHVHPGAIKALIQAKGYERVILVSDAMNAAGLPDGEYVLGELPVRLQDGAVRLIDSGSLAGSVLTIPQAIKNLVSWGILTEREATACGSSVPAQSVGISD
jgi:N-acetylglucosamine-6-phosphate deacetylase